MRSGYHPGRIGSCCHLVPAVILLFAFASAGQAVQKKAISPIPKPASGEQGQGHSGNATQGEQLHYVYEIGAYNKDNWVASWNALAVVVSLLHPYLRQCTASSLSSVLH
jgi:hypothetical protein